MSELAPSDRATLNDAETLESCVGRRPATFHLKSIDHLDEHCLTILAASTFSVLGVAPPGGGLSSVAVGGEPGIVAAIDRNHLALPPVEGLDVADGTPVGLLSFVPGYRETLRVNGRLAEHDGAVTVTVEEAFLHCAKALIRSHLWDAVEPPAMELADGPARLTTPAVAAFLAASPFVTLASCDADGAADVSPKGDPAGLVVQVVDDTTVAIADRPGNGRTDTMHNLLGDDRVSVVAFVPGLDQVVEVRGRGAITDDAGIRAGLAVAGKVPKAAIVVTTDEVRVRRDPAIGAARLWDQSRHVVRPRCRGRRRSGWITSSATRTAGSPPVPPASWSTCG